MKATSEVSRMVQRRNVGAIERQTVVGYVIRKHFDGDLRRVSEVTGFTKQQLQGWVDGKTVPRAGNVAYLMHHAFAPTSSVIAEFERIENDGARSSVHKQLASMVKENRRASGLYAFYDSMLNLVYVGKSNGNLLAEISVRLRSTFNTGEFPKGAPRPKTRLDVVQYVSIYKVTASAFEDYAKHVESLILRISKPPLNTNIGWLEKT